MIVTVWVTCLIKISSIFKFNGTNSLFRENGDTSNLIKKFLRVCLFIKHVIIFEETHWSFLLRYQSNVDIFSRIEFIEVCNLSSDNTNYMNDIHTFSNSLSYRSGTVNSNTVNSNFHLIRSKTLPTNDFELSVPDLY